MSLEFDMHRRILVTFFAIAILFHAVQSFAQSQQVFPAVDDTWTVGLNSTTLKGDDVELSICPLAGYWIYLKFDLNVPSTSVVLDAELQMTRVSGSRPNEISLYRVDSNAWAEETLNGQNRPEPRNPDPTTALVAGATSEGGLDSWTSEELLLAVRDALEGDGVISLMVREDPDESIDVRDYNSKEATVPGIQKPILVLTTIAIPNETIASRWQVEDIGFGVKPAFEFDSTGGLHVMSMTETPGGYVKLLSAPGLAGPWSETTLDIGYFYGPGDVAVHGDEVHVAWHDHDEQNATHAVLADGGSSVTLYNIDHPGHDGWDNALAFSKDGTLHQSATYPIGFGASNSLEYGTFDGSAWDFRIVPRSGAFMYGLATTIATDRMNRPHIAYCSADDWTLAGELNYATMGESGWQLETVAGSGLRGRFPSIATDHWDRPHIAWMDIDLADVNTVHVMYGVKNGDEWEIEQIDTLDDAFLAFDGARESVSLVLDSNWRPHIAYGDETRIRYATRVSGNWAIEEVLRANADLYNGQVDLELDGEENPTIVFWQRGFATEPKIRGVSASPSPGAWMIH